MSKTKREIIDETAAFYNTSNRAVSDTGLCRYNTDDGRQCAVGRCVKDAKKLDQQVAEFTDSSVTYAWRFVDFKDEYAGHCQDFWRDLQRLHDSDGNWDESGLTGVGQSQVSALHDRWDEEEENQP